MLWTPLVQVALSLLFSAAVSSAASVERATTCNGHAELCDRSYGNVSFVGAHDSYAVGTNNIAANQDYNVTQQLNDGIRMLQMQAHNQTGVIQLCHTSCFLYNGGTLEDYLTKVKTWMDANTNDVVTLLIVNIDNLPASAYGSVFAKVGLDKLSYAPTTSPLAASSWPTLGSMIDAGTRLVSFLDNAADLTALPVTDLYPRSIFVPSPSSTEFTNVWETPFDVTDPAFDCSINRTKGDTSTQMYLINHFLDTIAFNSPVPDVAHANTTNGVSGTSSLGAQVDTCVAAYGRAPNYMLVDFYEYGGGSVFQVAATINGAHPHPEDLLEGGGGNNNSGSLASPSQYVASLFVVLSVLLGAMSVV
ncbi:PLC-like phosphodiesterase [Mycena venus]|uniref:PLC-like phosphodiesterase n=1 Tax=Mycena venus TaxID=2733690 RepID=A0A8H6XW40_9AGAR|nr:PLC-like phosphodiesterase [Mycena venus]